MTQKIAIAIIHGIGEGGSFDDQTSPKYANGMAQALKLKFAEFLGCFGSEAERLAFADRRLAIVPIYWAGIILEAQQSLWKRLNIENLNSFFGLREFVFRALADSIAYQVTSADTSNRWTYDGIHRCVAQGLQKLAQPEQAGSDAPLCIIAHSLGTIIINNYLYDLQTNKYQIEIGNTPLEQGETFTSLYTLGSQIAFWSLRHQDFGAPISVPAPQLSQYHPQLEGEWINFFDRDDLLGYPLKSLNEKYHKAVTQEREVNAGTIVESWNPTSHDGYWTDEEVIHPIADDIARLWRQVGKVDEQSGG
ncbi:MAG: hypothetical protein ACFB4I_18535 [Cyanophyceae cyanobacterium]